VLSIAFDEDDAHALRRVGEVPEPATVLHRDVAGQPLEQCWERLLLLDESQLPDWPAQLGAKM
jgi:hypothetical protein